MELLSGFAWPVPRAFAGAVSACRFEQGDVLYSDGSGYEAWHEGSPRPAHRIQVLDPPKTARALTSEAGGKRALSNWTSRVELIVAAGDGPASPACVTTQGRLFTALWQGDLGWLEREDRDPEPPLLQRDLHKRLPEVAGYFRRRFARRKGARDGGLYLSAVDEASDASIVKAHGIESLLADRAAGVVATALPGQAGLEGAERFHPALVLHAVALPGADPAAVEELLAGLLYAGGADRDEEGSGRFSLSRHGLLLAPDDPSDD